MASYPLSLREFRSWLESKDKKEIVGIARKCTDCPIFNCLRDKNIKVDEVFLENSEFNNYEDSLNNPNWVKKFIEYLDFTSIVPYVSVSQALEVLNNSLVCAKCNQRNEQGTNCGRQDCDW